MKEATGELNMTVVTLVAIAAIGAVFYFVVWPLVQRSIVNQTCRSTYGTDWFASTTKGEGDKCEQVNTQTDTGSQADVQVWYCCKKSTKNNTQQTTPTTNQ